MQEMSAALLDIRHLCSNVRGRIYDQVDINSRFYKSTIGCISVPEGEVPLSIYPLASKLAAAEHSKQEKLAAAKYSKKEKLAAAKYI